MAHPSGVTPSGVRETPPRGPCSRPVLTCWVLFLRPSAPASDRRRTGNERLAPITGWLRFSIASLVVGCALSGPGPGRADDPRAPGGGQEEPTDLGLGNFFTGWDQPEAERHRATKDMALFRVETAYVEKEFRLDFVHSNYRGDSTYSGGYATKASLAYAVSRRLQLEVSGLYAWNVLPGEPPPNGAAASVSLRFALVEAAYMNYAFQVELETPNRGIGEGGTAMAYSLAGWQDMTRWLPSLGPVGLYYSLKWVNVLGPIEQGEAHNFLSWDVSVARSWTRPDLPGFGRFTTFLEAWMETALDGDAAGKLNFTLTPGVRFWFLPENSIILGADIPLNSAAPYSVTWRATYFLGF